MPIRAATRSRNISPTNPGYLAGPVLVAALAIQGEMTAAEEAGIALLQLRPEFSLNWMGENLPATGELADRLREGMRKAGLPEE